MSKKNKKKEILKNIMKLVYRPIKETVEFRKAARDGAKIVGKNVEGKAKEVAKDNVDFYKGLGERVGKNVKEVAEDNVDFYKKVARSVKETAKEAKNEVDKDVEGFWKGEVAPKKSKTLKNLIAKALKK